LDERIRVAVVYGGQSSEHEVSLQSAKCVLDNLDPELFEIVPIAIDRNGTWHAQDIARLRAATDKALPVDEAGGEVSLASGEHGTLVAGAQKREIDVVFPVMHGPLCEDGSIQGLLELADVAYVGAGVLGSAVCMDKDVAKRLARAAGIDTVEYLCVRASQWPRDAAAVRRQVAVELGYPVFVKPANLGSSVGVSKIAREDELERAVSEAFTYDTKVLIERAVDAREIELAVLSALDPTAPPEVSVPGEIVAKDAFYSYERKYLDPQGAELRIPAKLGERETSEAKRIARASFVALECEGMARIDLFLERKTGRLLFSEANTIPGFTTISMYPKLWQASGLSYRELLTRLVALALQRQIRRRGLKRTR
jgi:D-alanine-D-alanine ligase